MKMTKKNGPGTTAIHGGHGPYDSALPTEPVIVPVHLSTTFAFDTVEDHQNSIFGDLVYPMYTRAASGNPTTRELESKLAALYGAEAVLATASGMAAINYTLMHLLNRGDHVVMGRCYRLTHNIAQMILGDKMGVDYTLMLSDDVNDLPKYLKSNTKVLMLDIPSNPMITVYDLEKAVQIAHERGITVVLDETCATPINLRAFDMGVDIIACALTKYLCGHGDAVGGAIISNAKLIKEIRHGLYPRIGAAISPFNAWLIMQGLKTLHLRMPRHNQNAQDLATYLEGHPKVARVNYPGLASHPQHELAKRMMSGFGGMMSFVVRGGDEAGTALTNKLKLGRIGTSFGQAETMIETGWMSHYEWSIEDRVRFGIPPGFVRVSVGLEETDDLIADFEQALDQVEVDDSKTILELAGAGELEWKPTVTTME
jgi:cystathionine beta-lyase/cystathionine gamma-synthase